MEEYKNLNEERLINENGVHLLKLFDIVSRSRKLFLITFILIVGVFSFFALSMADTYKSSAMYRINDFKSSSRSNELSGLANLAGINIEDNSQFSPQFVINKILSNDFSSHLYDFPSVKEDLIAMKGFNVESRNSVYDEKIFDQETSTWKKELFSELSNENPSRLEFQIAMHKGLSISSDKNGFINISFEHVSPFFAFSFLNLIVEEFNETIRKNDLKLSNDKLIFYQNKIDETTKNDIKSLLNNLVTLELENQALIFAEKEYLIKTIDSPSKPETSANESRLAIIIAGLIFGFLFSLSLVVLKEYLYRSKN
tara:strand:+ start:500 stop:1435 length:936 start_codon:yes stop_codon:yes gene_type:complete